jgi:hypothetical protein
LGQAEKCGGVKPVNGIQPSLLDKNLQWQYRYKQTIKTCRDSLPLIKTTYYHKNK